MKTSCSIEYCEEVGRYRVRLDSKIPGWFQDSSEQEERLFDTVEECYHWALCALLDNNVSVFRRIRTSTTSVSEDEGAVHIQIGPVKRKRRGKKKSQEE